ncbi:sensor histidine kinase [Paenibacillus agricola]|uniref:histidine kinase n=1 Tax=Paenibacillus agricola TaxID=2716264 RepID=A0ABX0J6L4_9BACL|nr:sensor histidine kinase [Paenibacillus agricola]NHN30492.1 sensor histidine kinase [Paenibacillus agricola]
MLKKYHIFPKSSGLNLYMWLGFGIMPFYFIIRSSSNLQIVSGILLIIAFFFCYRLTLSSKGWPVYVGISLQIAISIAMTILFSYSYFSFFLAFFIGNIQNRAGFITLYTIHLVTTVITINIGFVLENKFFVTQLPFILISLIGVILLPLGSYNRNKHGVLQEQLKDANIRIAEMVKIEERQRIARDLHDTLGQKLSLIGLKSDLASKLIIKDPEQARAEIKDVQQTARTALKEIRQLVSQMRGTRIEEEIFRVEQILKAAEIEFSLQGNHTISDISLLSENVLSMCLKESVTNVVKHSGASLCSLTFDQTQAELLMKVHDNGSNRSEELKNLKGNGLQGMKERLEFVNGSLKVVLAEGTTLIMRIPKNIKQPDKDDHL